MSEMPTGLTRALALLVDFNARNEDVAKVPENIFVAHLLPLLSAAPGTEVDLSVWLDLAGSPHRPMDITAPDGSVLFRCPALMRQLPTAGHNNRMEHVNYGEIVAQAEAHGSVFPGADEAYLRNVLMRVEIGVDGADLETARQWNSIRQRYGLTLLPLPGAQTNSDAPVAVAEVNPGDLLSDDQDDF